MPENNQAEALTEQQKPEPTVHDFVDAIFGGVQRYPQPDREEVDEAETQAEEVNPAVEEPAEPVQAEPTAEQKEIARLTKERDDYEKSYRHLQSTIDGRINAANKGLQEKVDQLMEKLNRLNTSPANRELEQEMGIADPKSLTREDIEKTVRDALEKDEGIRKGQRYAELVEFRTSYPDSEKYDLFAQKLLDKWPELKSRGVKQIMTEIYELSSDLEQTALAVAKAMEEAAKAGKSNVTGTEVAKTTGKLSQEKANQITAKAEQLKRESGVSTLPTQRQRVNYKDPYKKQLDTAVQNVMKQLFGE